MALVVQVVVTGLAAGAVYGLVALGYSLIYRLTGVIHLALGELIGLAVFLTLFFAAGTGPVTRTNLAAGRFGLAMVGGLLGTLAAGALVYLAGVRPFLRRGSMLGWVGGVVAAAFAIRGLLAASFERGTYVFPDPFGFDQIGDGGVVHLFGASIPVRAFFTLAVGIALAALAAWILDRTDSGRALQAIAQDPFAARVVGLPVEWLQGAVFALAGALAGVVAIVGSAGTTVSVESGGLLGLKGLAAALIARFGSPWTAFAAGLGVGVLETSVANLHLGGLRLGVEYRDLVPLALALVVMALRQAAKTAPVDE